MRKQKLILTSLLLLVGQVLFCQQFENFNFLITNVDKITISTINFIDKTTEIPKYEIDSISKLPYPIEEDVKESITNTGTAQLNKKEFISLYQNLKTIKKGHALPYQYDIQLDFYKKGKVVQTATISSYTKNLVLKKDGCKTCLDEDGQEIDPCFFMGKVSKKLKRYVVSLLKKKKLWNKEQQFFEDL